jgi:hypothetical protein
MTGSIEIINEENKIVADIEINPRYFRTFDQPTAEAHAALICAAPDMFEALVNLENDNLAIPTHAWDMIKEAIKKAKPDYKIKK